MTDSQPPLPSEESLASAAGAAALLRATLEATADGILVVNPRFEILLRNRQFLRMWKIPQRLAQAQTQELLPYIRDQLKDPEQSMRQLDALFRSPDAEGFAAIECADGRVFERYTTVMQLEHGASARVLSFRDVTARVAAEQEAREAKEAAETANRAKSDFLDNVSHEIRTPLNGVLGLTRLLLAEGLTPRQRHYVELADASASSLLELIEDLLDLGKIESGRMELEPAPFRLDELLDELHDLYRLRAQESELRFVLEVDPKVPQAVRGDAGRLRQILNNLLSNALKFTAHGEFGLMVGRSVVGAASGMLRFTVYDTGIGIPFPVQQRLFSRFSQADRATGRRYGGTGLGLAIVKQLTDMMGGTILLQSEPGRGTSVRFELPLPEVAAGSVPARTHVQQAAPSPPPPRPTRVLVAEDNETNQVVVRGLLAQAGYHDVTIVGDGEQAVDAAALADYDLVLMDCRMPRMDGYEASRQLRAQGFTQPIIALTANAAAGERERCLAWGMNEYLAKPIDAARLAQVLAEWTGQPAPANVQAPAAKPAAAPAADRVFDRAQALERLGGDEELLRVALDAFADNAPQVLQWARTALATGAATDLRRHLHSLAGSASMVGGIPLHRLAKELEGQAEAGALEEAGSGLEELASLLSRFLAEAALAAEG
ncbi:ATP-binding protein [Ramlibacter alkalitolerans]|uniref:histidine kinase n=1 Tax=Ramlibacter alkalitolerans TaxID=2039631 RepID=A0ABS1JTD3_9BURK|nr:ATP-binding protein [Ramlibacter alkalitolerans]MBL0427126.1 response regulator [Ramlibacter alkalitolerans]